MDNSIVNKELDIKLGSTGDSLDDRVSPRDLSNSLRSNLHISGSVHANHPEHATPAALGSLSHPLLFHMFHSLPRTVLHNPSPS